MLDKTDITKEEFKNNVRKYLEMNTLDYLDDESAIRTAHTTVSKFNETIKSKDVFANAFDKKACLELLCLVLSLNEDIVKYLNIGLNYIWLK